MRTFASAAAIFALACAAATAGARAQTDGSRALFAAKGKYEDVKEDLINAVLKRGLVVETVSRVGDMLRRTGKDLGAAKQVYDKAEAIQFCSAVLSRRMVEADPANLVFCPFVIVIYTLPSEPGTVHVGYRRPPAAGSPASRAALKAVDDLLGGIAREAVTP
jgi:uncharacterized protein (DUF302 family)